MYLTTIFTVMPTSYAGKISDIFQASGSSTKLPPKKLQESNFSKLLGEKLARGPVQVCNLTYLFDLCIVPGKKDVKADPCVFVVQGFIFVLIFHFAFIILY